MWRPARQRALAFPLTDSLFGYPPLTPVPDYRRGSSEGPSSRNGNTSDHPVLSAHFLSVTLDARVKFLSWLFHRTSSCVMARPTCEHGNVRSTSPSPPPLGISRKGKPWSTGEKDLLLELRGQRLHWPELTSRFSKVYPGRSQGSIQVFWTREGAKHRPPVQNPNLEQSWLGEEHDLVHSCGANSHSGEDNVIPSFLTLPANERVQFLSWLFEGAILATDDTMEEDAECHTQSNMVARTPGDNGDNEPQVNSRKGMTWSEAEEALMMNLRGKGLSWSKVTESFSKAYPGRSQKSLQEHARLVLGCPTRITAAESCFSPPSTRPPGSYSSGRRLRE